MDATDFSCAKTLRECLEWMEQVVREAGKIVKEGFEKPNMRVDTKEGYYDVVTEFDRRSEDYIIQVIREKYSTHKFIAEETSATSGEENVLTDAPTWIIDPIDGTMNFVHRVGLIAIGVALCWKGRVVLAVSYNPIMDEMFTATKGGGAHLNGRPIHTSNARLLQEALVAEETSIGHTAHTKDRVMTRTYNLVSKVPGMRALGSAVLTLAYVAAGRIDAYQIEFLKPWDIAGGALLIEEAGGVVRDSFTGGDFNIMKPNVLVAATQELFDAMWLVNVEESTGKRIELV